MMLIKDYEQKIQKEIDKDLSIRPNPSNECAGVYHRNTYIGITLPKEYMLDTRQAFHADKYGTPFRGVKQADQDIKSKLSTLDASKRKLIHEG